MRIASTTGVGTCARRKVVVLSLLSALLVATAAVNWPGAAIAQSGSAQTDAYYPARHNWEKKTPDLVVVVRWIRGGPALENFIGKVIESIE